MAITRAVAFSLCRHQLRDSMEQVRHLRHKSRELYSLAFSLLRKPVPVKRGTTLKQDMPPPPLFNITDFSEIDAIKNTLDGIKGKIQEGIEGKPEISTFLTYVLSISYATVALLGTTANVFVIFAICNHKKIRHLYHNLFIGTLALSDLMMCCLTLPVSLWELLNYEWPFGTDSNFFCGCIMAAKKLPLMLSATALCGIAWDRYQNLTYPER